MSDSDHPLHRLERAARDYDRACRASVRADNAVKNASHGYKDRRAVAAAEARSFAIHRSARLAEAAIAYARWRDSGGTWPPAEAPMTSSDTIREDEDADIDDMTLRDVKLVRMERMDNDKYWIAITRADGSILTIDVEAALVLQDRRVEPLVTARIRR